jgi:hypothetical protein
MLLRQIALRFDAATAQAAEPELARSERPDERPLWQRRPRRDA